ncbi:MAG: carbon monoxide dehydrogenase subunit G [Chloroflexota bacterium]|nr:carbon monoxide dehydrogenase subunit G [Chloroflexota bacterium]
MKVDGDYTMNAPREQVFETLMSVGALTGCLPGCERFEDVGGGRYETTLKAGVAGVRGTFTGAVTLRDPVPPESYTLEMEGSFKGGHVRGVGHITLEDLGGGKTRVRYNGDAQISGALASVGQRLMQPAARMMANQFFKCMESKVGVRSAEG